MRWLMLLLALPAAAAEQAAYDSTGRVIALLSQAEDFELSSNFVAVLPNGKRVPLLRRREGSRGPARQPGTLQWSTQFELPDGGRGRMEWKSEEEDAGIRYTVALKAESALDVEAIELVLDAPRAVLLNGSLTLESNAITLAAAKPASAALYSGEIAKLRLQNANGEVALDVSFDSPHRTALVDRWDNFGRSYQLRIAIARGPIAMGTEASLTTTLRVSHTGPPPPAAKLTLDTTKARYQFQGFGGNYCWNNASPITAYMLDNLKLAWARTEMKVIQWDKQRENPSPELKADFEVMRRFQKAGVPYVISIWWLPERFYTDAFEKPKATHFRLIKPEKWDELLDLLGGYLQYAKKEYGVEPDLFSFNEANIGVYVGQTPETHNEALKRIGAHFRKLRLKTRMLLGDATGPRDTHRFVLEAAADPDALQYVGAIGFHSWGGGTAEQYKAWGDVAEWLNLPLLVTELGVDAAAYTARSYDSYQYGLRETRMTQELLLHARPQGTQFWQFTNDYALARMGPDGTVEPTARFWLMKHFTDLSPQQGEALATTSDQPTVLFTAFRKDGRYTLHILNLGPARTVKLEGLPEAQWEAVETTEAKQFRRHTLSAATAVELPARSFTTLITK